MNKHPADGWPYASEELRLAAHAQDVILRKIHIALVFIAIALIFIMLVVLAIG